MHSAVRKPTDLTLAKRANAFTELGHVDELRWQGQYL